MKISFLSKISSILSVLSISMTAMIPLGNAGSLIGGGQNTPQLFNFHTTVFEDKIQQGARDFCDSNPTGQNDPECKDFFHSCAFDPGNDFGCGDLQTIVTPIPGGPSRIRRGAECNKNATKIIEDCATTYLGNHLTQGQGPVNNPIGAGLVAIDPRNSQDFIVRAQNKCDLLVDLKDIDHCSNETHGTCVNQYIECAKAEPFDCQFQDEAGMVACKNNPVGTPTACDQEVLQKLPSLIPQQCLGSSFRNQAQEETSPPVTGNKFGSAGGCSFTPGARGISFTSTLIFSMSLIPLAFRRKK